MEEDAFNLVISQPFSAVYRADVILSNLKEYPILVTMGVIASLVDKAWRFGERPLAVVTEESTSDKAEISRLAADREVTNDAGVSFVQRF